MVQKWGREDLALWGTLPQKSLEPARWRSPKTRKIYFLNVPGAHLLGESIPSCGGDLKRRGITLSESTGRGNLDGSRRGLGSCLHKGIRFAESLGTQ